MPSCALENSLGLEIVALRQQVSVLKRKHPRPRMSPWDQLFWAFLRRVWSRWAEVLVVVKPETVVRWNRAGFRLYWRFLSRRREKGRTRISSELRQLIGRMAKENPTWGAPRIHSVPPPERVPPPNRSQSSVPRILIQFDPLRICSSQTLFLVESTGTRKQGSVKPCGIEGQGFHSRGERIDQD